ncbi:diguanylate cyclase [Sulfurimonas sp.]|uniref:sensor domain-containing diguanylate cyclase n=1 Tax=Sulfurimonas sp. TaxID=2022749 RepID=UPI003D13992B
MNIYEFLKKQKHVLIIVIGFFVIFEAVIFFTIEYKEKEDKKTFLEFKSKELDTQIKMGEHYLNLIAKVLYDNVIDSDVTSDIMYKATQTNDPKKLAALREELYTKYEKDYEYMKKLGVRQFHFHLPGVKSFLRFHRPEKFGDSLVDVRESIVYVNRYKRPIECFEEGRIFNGFRHVYPIFKDKKFVGTVEISYSFKAFLEHVLEVNTQTSYLFLVNNDVINEKVFQDEKINYMRSAFEHYSIDKKTLNNSMGISLNDIFSINKSIASEVAQKIEAQDNFTIVTHIGNVENQSVVVSFIAVRNFDKKKVAYIVGYNYSITMDIVKKRSSQVLVLLSIVNAIMAFLIFALLRREKRKTELASKEAIHDPLTGILNRRGFDKILGHKVSVSRRYTSDLSIIFFDIDHFKSINDAYGHDAGDVALKELTEIIKKQIRESDIFARWGGEEFAILLPMSSLSDALLLTEKLQKKIEDMHFSVVEHLTCSFGVTQLKQNDQVETFLKRVDEFLYLAKTTGRNKIVADGFRA